MHLIFAQLLQGLHPKCEQLIGMTPCRHGYLPKTIPRQGVYLFSEGENHLYVGRPVEQHPQSARTPLQSGRDTS